MNFKVEFKPKAEKALEKLPTETRQKVALAIYNLSSNPRPSGCKKLQGSENAWRIRINDYRVVYSIIEQKLVIQIINIGHRKDIDQ